MVSFGPNLTESDDERFFQQRLLRFPRRGQGRSEQEEEVDDPLGPPGTPGTPRIPGTLHLYQIRRDKIGNRVNLSYYVTIIEYFNKSLTSTDHETQFSIRATCMKET